MFALILAGGRSERMGQPKEWLPFGGTTLLGCVVQALANAGLPVTVVARDPSQALPDLPAGTSIARDAPGPAGPLRGLVGGLQQLQQHLRAADLVFVAACDAPFGGPALAQELATALASAPDALAAAVLRQGHRQPLGALYRPAVLSAAVTLLAAGVGSLQALLDQVPHVLLRGDDWPADDPRRRAFIDLDTWAEYVQHRPGEPPLAP